MMVKIAPSILAANFNYLSEEVELIDKAGCDYIHCDIMDGHFVQNISFGPDVVKNIKSVTKKIIDVHLMIDPVMPYIEKFAASGADIITFHVEADKDPLNIIKKIKEFNIKAGIAIKPNTPTSSIEKILKYTDLILIMTVEPGFSGQKFLNSQLPKIKEIKKLIDKMSLKIDIEVDGGINNITGRSCIKEGANILVAGSYIFEESKDYYKDKIDSLR